jgi:2-polyprenyl-3-methyl-5-hydroxy-6-metoxy-1,4-benzoquinol methylase
MHRPTFDPQWPDNWQQKYAFDRAQVWGDFPRSVAFCGWEARAKPIVEAVVRRLPSGSRLMDVASSQGNLAIELADLGYRVTWNDQDEELVGYVKLKDPEDRLTYVPGNFFDLAESHGGQWDGVVATEIIEHVAHPDEMLVALAALVRPRGYLFMSTPNGQYFRDKHPRFSDFADTSGFEGDQFKADADGHIFFLHRDEIESIAAKTDLEVVDFQTVGNPLTSGHVKLGALVPHLPPRVVAGAERLTTRLPERQRAVVHRHSVFTLQRH